MKKPWKLCLLLKKPTKSNKLKKTRTRIIVLIKTATYSSKTAAQSRSPNISCLPCILKNYLNKRNKTLPAIFHSPLTQKLLNKLQETHAKLCDVYFWFYPRGIYGTCRSSPKASYLKWHVTLLKSSKNIMVFCRKTHCDFGNSKTVLMPGSDQRIWLF